VGVGGIHFHDKQADPSPLLPQGHMQRGSG
jgi:hypothetical protein